MKKDTKNFLIVGVILFALVYIGGGGDIQIPSFGATGGTGTTVSDGVAPGAILTTNPSLILSLVDEKTGSAMSATVNLLDAQGNQITSSSGTSITFSNLTSDTTYTAEVVTASGFYGKAVSVKSPSAGAGSEVIKLNYSTSGSPTVTCYDSDDVTNNGTTAQAIGANDERTLRCRVRPPASTNDNNFFSDGMLSPVLVCDLNGLAYQSLTVREGSTLLSSTGAPSNHTIPDANRTKTLSYMLASKTLNTATDYDLYFTLKSTSLDPCSFTAGGGCDANAGIYCTLYDSARIKDTMTGKYIEAYSNPRTNADVGGTNWTWSIYMS